MKVVLPAASMAAIIASTTTLGVARGFNVAKHIARSRSTSLASSRRFGSRASPFHRRTASSTCFIRPEESSILFSAPPAKESSTSSSSSSAASTDNIDEVEQTARNSLSITGSLPPPKTFGGIPYLDTSSLTSNHSHRVLFILGGPGAGKGTQSERIVDTYKCVHLSAGDLLRTGAEKKDYPHADLVKECLVQGKIVPVELSLGLLRIAMDEAADEVQDGEEQYGSRIFLVDGFPRNFDNVQGWMEHMPSYTAVLGSLVYNCPIEILEERIMSRAETSGRSDDNLESARRRFATFKEQTEPVVRVLERVEELQAEKEGSMLDIVNIDGTGSIEDVWAATEEAMDSYVKNDVLTANANLLKAIEEGDIDTFTNLCGKDLEVDPIYEGPNAKSIVSNASVDIKDGIKAVVVYDREVKEGLSVHETREWEHGPKGWKCVSVSRDEL